LNLFLFYFFYSLFSAMSLAEDVAEKAINIDGTEAGYQFI
jgi:hypothetical protein